MEFKKLILYAIDNNATDLYISEGVSPAVRIYNEIKFLKVDIITGEDIQQILCSVYTDQERENLHAQQVFSVIKEFEKVRCRVKYWQTAQGGSITIKLLSYEFRQLKELNAPPILFSIPGLQKGLVVLVGTANSGKTTTINALLDYINQSFNKHVITIEDVIEHMFVPKHSIIKQLEVGNHIATKQEGLYIAAKEQPDIVVITELNSLEVLQGVIKVIETGCLVIITLYADSCVNALNKLLAMCGAANINIATLDLKAVVAQKLLLKKRYQDLIAIFEVLLNNTEVQQCIKAGNLEKLEEIMLQSEKQGMQHFSRAAGYLLEDGSIDQHVYNNVMAQDLYVGREKDTTQITYDFLEDDDF